MRFILLLPLALVACTHPAPKDPTPNWQNLDLQHDGVFGISTEKAYDLLLKNKKATTVVVAVIDSGIDTTQEDLRTVLWTDPADGSHGRSYIGPETGKEDFIPMLAQTTDTGEYHRILDDYNFHVVRLQNFVGELKESRTILDRIVKHIGKDKPAPVDLNSYQPRDEDERRVISLVQDRLPLYRDFEKLRYRELDHLLELGEYHLEHALNRSTTTPTGVPSTGAAAPPTSGATGSPTTPTNPTTDISNDPLGLVADPNVSPEHGTHMSGIIAAVRNNGTGINGISNHTRILSLKLSNNIREMRNTDLASAIRYAADHGAKIINMSFGKSFSLHRDAVDAAVKYAMSRDVLIVHSAGNDGKDLDNYTFFPSPIYLDGAAASAWLTVGASGYRDDTTLVPAFSNYGRHNVDVFAPGVQITSTIGGSRYASWDGTSVATPVVTGLAALIRSYYPQLTAVQVKDIIMRSVVRRKILQDKCVSGGVANAYNALQLADKYK